MTEDTKPVDLEDCREFLWNHTFPLRSPEYSCKYPKWPGAVGLEIEMLPVRLNGGDTDPAGPVPLHGPGETTATIIRNLSEAWGWRTTDATEPDLAPMLLSVQMDHGDYISFEPGGQVEFSSTPYPCLSDALCRMHSVQETLQDTFARHGVSIVQTGINPWNTVETIGLQMPKARYRAMDRYYRRIGEYGPRMMRQTCTLQVNLDFGPSETIMARRYLVAMLAAPVVTALFAFSPQVDNRMSGLRCFRSRIWRHTDPTHTGVPGLGQVIAQPTRSTLVDTYLNFALDASVVFVAGRDYEVPPADFTFRQWLASPFAGLRPTLEDFKTHLSLLFPEVRARGFLELRSVDCQARAWQNVPPAFYTGLLYDDSALEEALELLLPHAAAVPDLLVHSEDGLGHGLLRELAMRLMAVARAGYGRLPECFRAVASMDALDRYFETFTARGRTPADDLVDAARADGVHALTPERFIEVCGKWDSN